MEGLQILDAYKFPKSVDMTYFLIIASINTDF